MPPESQKLPAGSVQLVAKSRLPGMFPSAGVPNVPYTPDRPKALPSMLLPPIQVHPPIPAAVTVIDRAGDWDAPKLASPGYAAVMLLFPTGSAAVFSVATPFEIAPVPRIAPPL